MHLGRNRWSVVCGLALMVAMAFGTSEAMGQAGGGGNQGGNGVAGVEIDADGVLRTHWLRDPAGQLTRQRIAEARIRLSDDMEAPSKLRKISLTRLEKAVAEALERGEQPSMEMLNLGGLTSIEYVFYYPETKEIVIAGPAEGFYKNAAGRYVGLTSGKATLQLEDLVVAMRAFNPNDRATHQIGCSIDPTAEGLQKMQQFLSSLRGIRPSDANRIAMGLRENLGKQVVSVYGVSPNTHFAQVLVEADYRMKMIGIGLEQPAADIPSYVSRANPRDVARNAMCRWYFTPDYDCVRVSEDDLAMQLVGKGVKLVGEDELVGADGGRSATANRNRASAAFCTAFTRKYDELAENTPVYAQLKSLVDMSIVAAYIQKQDYYGQADWDLGVFGDESAFSVENYSAPTHVESAVNVVWKGSTLMTPIGGGVEILASEALTVENMKYDERGSIAEMRDEVMANSDADQWWWD